jgi:heterodisulfide reductase subunit A
MDRCVAVIGGGIAGLTAGEALAKRGVKVVLIERGPFVGGNGARLACKATDRCLKCNNCLVEERLREVFQKKPYEIRVLSEILEIGRVGPRFVLSGRSQSLGIDGARCTRCGLCFEKCQTESSGALLRAPSHHITPFFVIDRSRCSDSCKDQPNAVCASVCPEGAVDLTGRETSWRLEVDGVVLATGYVPFNPERQTRYSYSKLRNMITAMDLEEMLRSEQGIGRVSDGRIPEKVAFVQCVGSRDARLKHEYCSRVCCGYALRMGLKIVHAHPEIEITVFFMDIQSFGKDYDHFYEEASKKLKLVRGLPGDFYGVENERVQISYFDEGLGQTVAQPFDLVVLSVGITPPASNVFFGEGLGMERNEDGFLMQAQGMAGKNVVIVGTAEGPMDVSECITHAERGALDLLKQLGEP